MTEQESRETYEAIAYLLKEDAMAHCKDLAKYFINVEDDPHDRSDADRLAKQLYNTAQRFLERRARRSAA